MTTVFIAGSINIRNLDVKVKERLDNIIDSRFDILIGDANGADTSIQQYLSTKGYAKPRFSAAETNPETTLGRGQFTPWQTHRPADHAPSSPPKT
jgi:hypothetical protein